VYVPRARIFSLFLAVDASPRGNDLELEAQTPSFNKLRAATDFKFPLVLQGWKRGFEKLQFCIENYSLGFEL
jgi:hypothetical protein